METKENVLNQVKAIDFFSCPLVPALTESELSDVWVLLQWDGIDRQ